MTKWSKEIDSHSSRAAGDLDAPSIAEIAGDEDPSAAVSEQIETARRMAQAALGSNSLAEGPLKIKLSGQTDAERTDRSGRGWVSVRVGSH